MTLYEWAIQKRKLTLYKWDGKRKNQYEIFGDDGESSKKNNGKGYEGSDGEEGEQDWLIHDIDEILNLQNSDHSGMQLVVAITTSLMA